MCKVDDEFEKSLVNESDTSVHNLTGLSYLALYSVCDGCFKDFILPKYESTLGDKKTEHKKQFKGYGGNKCFCFRKAIAKGGNKIKYTPDIRFWYRTKRTFGYAGYHISLRKRKGRGALRVLANKNDENATTVSHLCGNSHCCQEGHTVVERKTINDDRTICHKAIYNIIERGSMNDTMLYAFLAGMCKHEPMCFSTDTNDIRGEAEKQLGIVNAAVDKAMKAASLKGKKSK